MHYVLKIYRPLILLLFLGNTWFVVAQDHIEYKQKQVEVNQIEGINHSLQIELSVKSGARTRLTVSGNQPFHDALIISSTDDEIY